MRRRLYFMLPDVESARAMLNDLLIARIECRHIHFRSRRDSLPDDLPQASVLQKTDIVHGEMIARRHPEAASGGFEPTIPAFP